ncbi:SusC/RagA family TonB-linked outer membrane protein [Wenyingzhuangia aestuarii]|uniref:SusC/RagA family TonB-linked outer membrane protein n=1 Tax=Wenyingzhuangia aestuarii TaxID=1647582 RepID=UPI001438BB15|nr:TonB-dependent receptor [Wenyingzhuangia aestuarii]NJB83683.1 TonB-linked SusC/RagA family outer membrane protein [Wenyingzhuangia aestuarii]
MNLKNQKNWRTVFVLCCCFLMCFTIEVQAQKKIKVRGVVTSIEDGEPIPGLSVVVKETGKATVTDFDGNYTIKAKIGETLNFSYIGMEEKAIKVRQENLNVRMSSSLENLEEVIVIGYGTQKKKELTGAVNRLNADKINNTITPDLSVALQGQVAGVAITPSSEPGEAATILIRGLASAEGDNTPLYVVDGVPQFGDPQISPNDIESIDILKDAASASIYGSRGAAGVILITTKQAKEGTLKVSLNATRGVNKITSGIAYMDAPETLYFLSEYQSDNFNYYERSSLLNNTNIVDVVENDLAPSTTLSLGISGGTKELSYNITGGYLDQESNIINSNFKRYNVRANAKLTKGHFSFTPGMSIQYEKGISASTSIFRDALAYSALSPAIVPGQFEVITSNDNGAFLKNVFSLLSGLNSISERERNRSSFNMRSQYNITDDLSFVSNFGYTEDILKVENYNPRVQVFTINDLGNLEDAGETRGRGSLQYTNTKKSKLLLDGGLNYNKKFGDHRIQGLALMSIEEDNAEAIRVSRSEFNITTDGRKPLISEGAGNPSVTAGAGTAASNNYKYRTVGIIGRLLYDYKGKYLVNVSVRRDGSSKFFEGNRWETFPSVSVGWNVSDENFWQPINAVVNNFKIRVSQGTTGSDRIRPDSVYSLVTYGSDYADSNGNRYQGGTLRTHANPASRWETTKQLNIGTDLSFFKNKITFTTDYYVTTKTDMLFPLQTPPSIGGGSSTGRNQLNFNVGDMENRGVEYAVTYRDQIKDFKWNLSGTFSKNRNKVVFISDGLETITRSQGVINGDSSNYSTISVGKEVNAFFLHKTDGVIKTQEELENYRSKVSSIDGFVPELGDLKFRDANNDGIINDSDREYAGSPQPDYEIGLRSVFDYKNFDLTMQWHAVVGTEVINGTKLGAYRNQRHKDLVYMWTPTNTNSNIPRYVSDKTGHPNQRGNTDFWLEDGSFVRLNNITLGYSLPDKTIKAIGVNRFRCFVTAQNPLIFTGYTGYNPQISGSVSRAGVDEGRKPVSSLYSVGVNINF